MSNRTRGLNTTALTRRTFLQGSALAGAGAFIAACSGGSTPAPASDAAPTPKTVTGPLKFANWTAYIDLAGAAGEEGVYEPGSSPTLESFKTEFSVEVDYEEKIDGNNSFVETLKPAFVGGVATGWDLIVLTDWMAARLVENQWVEKIDLDNVPNCTANLRDALKNAAWDPNNDYHFPWQSGMTGIGYNATAFADNNLAAPTKLADLWNVPPDKLTMLDEARDTFGLTLLKLGIEPDPATVTLDDLQKVADDIQPLVDGGLRFTGNSYLQDFGQKKVWAAYVWSGDLASSAGPDDFFVFPEEGTMIWTDNMLIPKGAANKYTAELMMNYVYDPKIAAQAEAYIYYVSPVKGAKEAILELDPDAATNDLLFPSEAIVAKQRNFQSLTAEQEDKMNELFATLSGL